MGNGIQTRLANEVINDYFTPNIKAEVILDTLLTPYVTQIVKSQCRLDTELITKEMSVREASGDDQDNQDDRGAKIDYVLADSDLLYLVELKTVKGSISAAQAKRYTQNCRGKTFGMVLGNQLFHILSKKFHIAENSLLPASDKGLEALFQAIFKKYGASAPAPGSDYAESAMSLLKKRGWGSSYKYLYTAGQILNYREKHGDLWDKPLRLLYLTPKGEPILSKSISGEEREKWEDGKFYIKPNDFPSLSLAGFFSALKPDAADEYDLLVKFIIGGIYSVEGSS